jgi:3-phosphoshikimate 1-carboxyvinyltransferase
MASYPDGSAGLHAEVNPTPMALQLRVQPARYLSGTAQVPGDKSISHRALILGALASGQSHVANWLPAGDCAATLACLRSLGVAIERLSATSLKVQGVGLRGFEQPDRALDCQGSGTSMRLLAGLLAGQPFAATLDGHSGLRRRPMRRIIEPLRQMGARIEGRNGGYPPLRLQGGDLHGIDYRLPVASAQVKSCLLLAGLLAREPTIIHEPGPARDHTERMLRAMGAQLDVEGATVKLIPDATPLRPLDIAIPGDLSSAAFLIVAAAIVPGSTITLEQVGVNPTRTGLLDVMQAMGAQLDVAEVTNSGGEPVTTVAVGHSELQATSVGGQLVVRMIDEFPILAVAATQAAGETVVRDARELRVKETDRIAAVVNELRKMGAQIEERADGFVVSGPSQLHGAAVQSHGDHRLAMALAVAGLAAEGETIVHGAEVIDDSYPGFAAALRSLGAAIEAVEVDE